MKKLSTIFLSLLLIFSIFTPLPNYAEAAISKLRVLEIVAKGNSQIDNYLSKGNYTTTTITMKKFVAMREELDGKYDVIAIMDGTYLSRGVSGTSHNTTEVMNDITNLKANEIIKDFIEKGQPVIFHKDSIESGNKMNSNFSKYINSNLNNVFLVNSSKEWNWFRFDYDYAYDDNGFNQFITKYQQVPKFTLSQKPSDKTYVPSDKLEFTLDVSDINKRGLQAKLYIDSNFNDKYTTDEIVAEEVVRSSSTKISYEMPKGYSGVRYWKLELVDSANNLKSYEKGMVRFKGKTVDVKVLQVTNGSDSSSLTNKLNMKPEYLKKSGEYNIDITVVPMSTFNTESYKTINGKYDMVIFGFADSYNKNASIQQVPADAVKAFIASKQSMMFTHDTIFLENGTSSNIWVDNFKEATGQIEPLTNLGYGARSTSASTKKMNTGLMTSYPFGLGENISINTTHNQYYTLDLEDPEVIPWYNITGNSRDESDSWNHYYTYSKGNITYSGTGHTNTRFPDEEQQLFVNTMYRAFLGSNHAPEITVLSPAENEVIPSNQNIELSYTLQDYDLKDKKLSTKVFLNGKEVHTENDITNGATINLSLDHKLPEGGPVTIKIQAIDSSGAISEKEVKISIQKITAALEINRSVSVPNPVKKDSSVTITYKVTPRDITGDAAKAIKTKQVNVSSIKLNETFPAHLEVDSLGTKSGSENTGISLVRELPNIVYTKSGDKFTANSFDFTIKVKPKQKGQYILNKSMLSYTDLTDKKETPTFNTIMLDADVPLTELDFPTEYTLSKGTEKNFAKDLKFIEENAGIKNVVWSEESGGKTLKIDPVSGVATMIKEGTTYVKVRVTDNFGAIKEAQAFVTVRIPVEDFTVNYLELDVGETLDLPISGLDKEEKYSLTINLKDETIASIDKANLKITGLKPGKTDLIVFGFNKEGEEVQRSAKVFVKEKEVAVESITVTPDWAELDKMGTKDDFKVIFDPINATNQKVEWTSLSPNIVSILDKENGVIQGVATGDTIVKVTTTNGKEALVKVKVGQPLQFITVPETIYIQKGHSKNIIVTYHPKDATNIKGVEFSNDGDDYYIELDSKTGVIKGKRLSESIVTVTVTDDKGVKYTKQVLVVIGEKDENGDVNDSTDDGEDRY